MSQRRQIFLLRLVVTLATISAIFSSAMAGIAVAGTPGRAPDLIGAHETPTPGGASDIGVLQLTPSPEPQGPGTCSSNPPNLTAKVEGGPPWSYTAPSGFVIVRAYVKESIFCLTTTVDGTFWERSPLADIPAPTDCYRVNGIGTNSATISQLRTSPPEDPGEDPDPARCHAISHVEYDLAQLPPPTDTPVPPTATPVTPTVTPPGGATPTVTPPGGATPTVTPPGGATPTVTPPGGATPTVTPPGGATPTVTPPGGATPTVTPRPTREPEPDPGDPDLVISKTGGAQAQPGDMLTYEIVVANIGDGPANDVVVTDTLPDVLSVYNATTTRGVITVAGQTLSVEIGRMEPGDEVRITVVALVNSAAQPGGYTNTVSVVTSSPEQVTDNNTAQAPANVVNQPTALPASPTAGPGTPTAEPSVPTPLPGTPTEASVAPTSPATAAPPTQPPPSPPTRVPPTAISGGGASEGEAGAAAVLPDAGSDPGMPWLTLAIACWLLAGGSLLQLRRLEQDAVSRHTR